MSGENKELEVKLTAAETKLTATEAELAKLREENKTKETRLAEVERNMKLQSIDAELTALINAGKLMPAERKLGLDGFLACLPGTTVKLAEKDTTLKDWFIDFLKQRPAVVDLSGKSVVSREDMKPGTAAVIPRGVELADIDQASLDFAEKVREVQLRDKCDYATAMKTANAENPGLYDKTVKTKSR